MGACTSNNNKHNPHVSDNHNSAVKVSNDSRPNHTNQTPSGSVKDNTHLSSKSNQRSMSRKKDSPFTPLSKMSTILDITLRYDIGRHLGSGSFGLVREGTKRSNKETFAIKSVWKNHIPDTNYLRREIEVMLSIDHDNIIKCYEVYEDISCVHFVLEYSTGKELFDYIINSPNGCLDEKQSMELFNQMIDALHYLHSEGFMHRDIKPENFMIQQDKNKGTNIIKLIDFGFATDFYPNKKLVDKVGSINYIAPEMIPAKSTYDFKVDMWAIGVCLYNMIAGKQPFADENMDALTDKILNQPVYFNYSIFDKVNPKIKKLIEMLLVKDPEKRLSAAEVKAIPWIAQFIGLDEVPTYVEEFDPQKKAKNIHDLLKFKKNIKPMFWELCIENIKYSLCKELQVSFILNLFKNRMNLLPQIKTLLLK